MAKPRTGIANNLKWYRESYGYSLKDVAELLGHTSTSSISNWETGNVIPNLFTAFKLSRLCRTSSAHLFEDLYKLAIIETDASKTEFIPRKNNLFDAFKLSRLQKTMPEDLFEELYKQAVAETDAAEKEFLARKNKPHFTD
ncbi:helix-turn-helix domain-containing protein [Niastella populi]|uniref:HTH cro/C1-type domain-containing protein n=1 Tax=Niastella populi TaxID=550983 RepID=A0A1V9GBQ0_9BACT|nr:helix-turn-helix transcriptional regulator [Niastella populi]OQP67866.1 hypothetical protein A4R26_10190 [Niastella populi]